MVLLVYLFLGSKSHLEWCRMFNCEKFVNNLPFLCKRSSIFQKRTQVLNYRGGSCSLTRGGYDTFFHRKFWKPRAGLVNNHYFGRFSCLSGGYFAIGWLLFTTLPESQRLWRVVGSQELPFPAVTSAAITSADEGCLLLFPVVTPGRKDLEGKAALVITDYGRFVWNQACMFVQFTPNLPNLQLLLLTTSPVPQESSILMPLDL